MAYTLIVTVETARSLLCQR